MNCSRPLSCAMGASLRPRCRSRASRFLPRLRAEESSLLHCQNLENCQGTSVFLLLLFSKSTKLSLLYLSCFQSSAARPQAHARILCNRSQRDFQPPHSCNIFAALTQSGIAQLQISRATELWEIRQEQRPARISTNRRFWCIPILRFFALAQRVSFLLDNRFGSARMPPLSCHHAAFRSCLDRGPDCPIKLKATPDQAAET